MLYPFTAVLFLSAATGKIPNACASVQKDTLVNLRIEGSESTIFEGLIFTEGHNVSTPSGGTHECDGLNNHANPKAGPTATSALDDAARLAGFPFDGTFSDEFDDFFITSIGPDREASVQFWGLLLDFEFKPVGGCQQEVHSTNQVLWASNAFNATAFLKLEGPRTVQRGQDIVLTVTDGSAGEPIVSAMVGGQVTDAGGRAAVRFLDAGVRMIKATKNLTI